MSNFFKKVIFFSLTIISTYHINSMRIAYELPANPERVMSIEAMQSMNIVIQQLISNNPELTTIDFHNVSPFENAQYFKIGPNDANRIAEGLRNNIYVKKILLDLNYIGDEGAGHLARALETNECLEELSIASNKIGPEGIKSIARALPHNNTLKILNMYYNDSDFETIEVLIGNLQNNYSLTKISINTESQNQQQQINNLLIRNKSKQILKEDLVKTGLTLEDAQKLYDSRELTGEFKIIAPNGRVFKCHKGILNSRSKLFADMFEAAIADETNQVSIRYNLSPEALETLIEFLYKGQISVVTHEIADELINSDIYEYFQLHPDHKRIFDTIINQSIQ